MKEFFADHQWWLVPLCLYLAGALAAQLTHFQTSERYDAFKSRHPRLVVAIGIMRALLPYVPKAAEVLREARAKKDEPK